MASSRLTSASSNTCVVNLAGSGHRLRAANRRDRRHRSGGAGGERPRHARLQRTRVALDAARQICGLPAQDGIEPEQHDRRKRIEQLGSTDPEPGCEVDQAAPIEQVHLPTVKLESARDVVVSGARYDVEEVDVDFLGRCARRSARIALFGGCGSPDTPSMPLVSDDHARCAEGGGHLGDTAPVVLCLDEPHRIEIDDGHDGTKIAGASGDDALAHRPEPDHDDLAPVQRQTRDRREAGHVSTPTW